MQYTSLITFVLTVIFLGVKCSKMTLMSKYKVKIKINKKKKKKKVRKYITIHEQKLTEKLKNLKLFLSLHSFSSSAIQEENAEMGKYLGYFYRKNKKLKTV